MKKQAIYLDYAAATPLDKKVERVMQKAQTQHGNPASIHGAGQAAKNILEQSRTSIADMLNAHAREIIFTGSGTESCNLAILGATRAHKKKGKHIVTTNLEHHAVLKTCEYLEKHEGFEITYVPVTQNGIVDPKDIERAIRKDTILISVMYANNEIGTIQPIQKIARIAKKHKAIFHTDACQAPSYLNLNVQQLGVDLMSLSASKCYGPKGIGALFVRRNITLQPIMFGGDQEHGLRPGTQSPELAAGFAKALELAEKNREKETIQLTKLRNYFFKELQKKVPQAHINGDQKQRLPNNINISIPNIDGEQTVLRLSEQGIAVSTGAACTISDTGPSHVVKALLGNNASNNTLRITLGKDTTKRQLQDLITALS